jgi:two-component system NarL family response regulator
MNKVRVVLADDHQLMREGLRALLDREPDMEVVGEAGDGRQVLALVAELTPDVVAMDIAMPGLNGCEATRRIVKDFPRVRVVAMSGSADRRFVLRLLEAGACGYVVKAAASDELMRALRAAGHGQHYLCPDAARIVVSGSGYNPDSNRLLAHSHLASREREVLQLLAEGLSSRDIAERLHISVKTVETHRRNITAKLGLHSIAELTKYAIREGLTGLEQ